MQGFGTRDFYYTLVLSFEQVFYHEGTKNTKDSNPKCFVNTKNQSDGLDSRGSLREPNFLIAERSATFL